MSAFIKHPPPRKHISSHSASLCWLSFFLITENKVSPLLPLPPLHTFFAELMRLQTAHSTDTVQSLPQYPFSFFFFLLITTRLTSGSFHPVMVLPCIQRWQERDAQLLISGTQMHQMRGEPCIAEKEEEEEKIQHQKVEDRRLLCVATAWLNWVTRTGSDRQTLNIIHQNPPRSLEQRGIQLFECQGGAGSEGGKMIRKGWF